MPKPSWSGEVSRKIVRRIVVEGNLVLQTPAHLAMETMMISLHAAADRPIGYEDSSANGCINCWGLT